MGRIESLFANAKSKGKKVLVAYLCVGDPNEAESVEVAKACLRGGADILELGIPYSDPSADGPAIARASERAIANGGGIAQTLRVCAEIRKESAAPIVLFGYYNPLFIRGEAEFAREVHAAGGDALLVVDLPLDEATGLREAAKANGLSVIPLVAPTTSDARLALLKDVQSLYPCGFAYYVSVTGITGTLAIQSSDAGAKAARVRSQVGLPVVVGFGIDSREKARDAAREADGVVVGSAIVRAVESARSSSERVSAVFDLVRELRAGVDEAAAR